MNFYDVFQVSLSVPTTVYISNKYYADLLKILQFSNYMKFC